MVETIQTTLEREISRALPWLSSFSPLIMWIAGGVGLLFLAGLLLMPIFVARMRADYFLRRLPPKGGWADKHPVLRICLRAAKNALGLIFVLAGIAMLVLPGQGLLTIVAGLSLLEFPGKRRLELSLVRRGPVLRTLNWIREKAGREKLQLPDSNTQPPECSE